MCKGCEKRGAVITVTPLKKHFNSISGVNIEELCRWWRAEKADIVTVHFITEDITITIGLESEIEKLEEVLSIAYLPSRDAKLKEIVKEFTQ